MSDSSGDKTEKATPKKREEARNEGQVAKSQEINSAFAMLAGFSLLVVWGPKMFYALANEMVRAIEQSSTQAVTPNAMSELFFGGLKVTAYMVGPFLIGMMIIAVLANVLQVGFKITPKAVQPRLSKLNPVNGLKQKLSMTTLFELVKNVLKMIIIGVPATWIVYSRRDDMLALGDAEPIVAARLAADLVIKIGITVGIIYIFVAIIDFIWQRYRHEKQLKMSKSDVKREMRQQEGAPEIKAAQRRRQREAARRRMLADVPTADVIITNPTHYAVALKYDPEIGAPQVVAKGVDLLALRIREIAEEAGVMRVENRPLARQLYASVDVGQVIPPELFSAVAEVLAFVYRANGNAAARGAQRPTAADHRGGTRIPPPRRMEHA